MEGVAMTIEERLAEANRQVEMNHGALVIAARKLAHLNIKLMDVRIERDHAKEQVVQLGDRLRAVEQELARIKADPTRQCFQIPGATSYRCIHNSASYSAQMCFTCPLRSDGNPR